MGPWTIVALVTAWALLGVLWGCLFGRVVRAMDR